MNIDLKKKNKELSIITLEISSQDYKDKVESILNDYKKKANVPGFRKGFVPLGMIKKQYELPVKVDEINKLVQSELSKYITENNLSILGNPIPSENDDIDWKKNDIILNFDVAHKPSFKLNYKLKKPITHYQILADDLMIKNQIESYQSQYGKLISVSKIEDNVNVLGNFSSEELDFKKEANFVASQLSKTTFKKFLKLKVGQEIKINPKEVFNDKDDLNKVTGLDENSLGKINEISFKLQELNKNQKAEANEDLFKKIYPNDSIINLKDFKSKIKADIEKQFINQSDQKFLNDVTEAVIDSSKINLPKDFLKRLMKLNSKESLNDEELEKEYLNSEKGIKYQLIEEKIINENDIKINIDSIKEFATNMIKNQMAAYGQNNPDEKELNSILQRIMSNQDEVKRISNQIISEKLLLIYKEKVNKKIKKVSYEEYIEIAYKKNN